MIYFQIFSLSWLRINFYFKFIFLLSILFPTVSANGCLLEDDRNSVYVSVFEDAPIGSTLTELPIRGQTFGPDANIQLQLIQGSEYVSLDPRTKKLTLEKELDRDEGLSRFEILIECKSLLDDHFPELNISTFVTVKDVNDNSPEFDKDEYFISIPEELPEGTPIALEFEATDNDQEGPNSFIRYRIVGSDSDEDEIISDSNVITSTLSNSNSKAKQFLKIPDPYKPQIVVGGRIDFEKIRRFEVEIEAEDGGNPPLKSRAKLTAVVLDMDDLNPIFQHENYYTNSIQDSVFEVFPDPIFAKDADTLNDPVYYEITGEFADSYSINGSGIVRLIKNDVISTTLFIHEIRRNAMGHYFFYFLKSFAGFLARQINRPERFATAILRVTNQSSIEFQHLVYSVQLTSNSPKGMEVAQVKAISSTPNIKLRYNIIEDESDIAYIEELTGRIFLNSTPTKDKYTLKLLATDGKSRAWSKLELTVKKVNVFEPEFDQPEYIFDLHSADLIGQIRASDRDENDTLTYKLLNLQNLFHIDHEGMLSHKPSTSLIPGTTYELVVMAEDGQKHKSVVTVFLRTHGGKILVSVLCIAGATLCVFIGMFIARKLRKVSFWATSQRQNCRTWRNKQASDSGVVITRSLSTDMDSYHRQRYRSSSPAEEKNRETVAMNYSNAATSFPPPPLSLATAATAGGPSSGVSRSASAIGLRAAIQYGAAAAAAANHQQQQQSRTAANSPVRNREIPSILSSSSSAAATSNGITPTIYFQ
uniref:Cadherin domain-containing protein n=1 Tax=Panagrolaimus sp. PS1159 TaxID=55785 RepID=A0AC35GP45_9BILA